MKSGVGRSPSPYHSGMTSGSPKPSAEISAIREVCRSAMVWRSGLERGRFKSVTGWRLSLDGHAAVDGEDVTGHKGGRFRRGKHDCLRDLVRGAGALERQPRDKAGLGVRTPGEAVEHPSLNRAGRDRIDPHAKRGAFQRSGPGQSFDRV